MSRLQPSLLGHSRNPLDILSWLSKYMAAGASFQTRATHILDFLVKGQAFIQEGFESTCHVASRIAQRLGMLPSVQVVNCSLSHTFIAYPLLRILSETGFSYINRGCLGHSQARIPNITCNLSSYHLIPSYSLFVGPSCSLMPRMAGPASGIMMIHAAGPACPIAPTSRRIGTGTIRHHCNNTVQSPVYRVAEVCELGDFKINVREVKYAFG